MARKKSKNVKAPQATQSPQATPQRISLSDLPVKIDVAVNTSWVDRMEIAIREDVPIATMSFQTHVQGENGGFRKEITRICTSLKHLEEIAQVLARVTGHEPLAKKKKAGEL